MTQQKSEDRIVPEDQRKLAPTHRAKPGGGGKAAPVDQRVRQLNLPFATAENPRGATGGADTDLSVPAPCEAPKANVKDEKRALATMEEVTEHLTAALQRVVRNQGAPGPDGETTAQLNARWVRAEPELAASLMQGTYSSGLIRRVLIPKSGGGERGLGIPNVIDRVVQEAVRRVIEPLYEPTFHESSHGFRPGRSCHTAIAEAKKHVEAGYEWVVDMDLEKFFDQVCQQRLRSRLAQRVRDRRLLGLVDTMLKAKVVLPDGVVVATNEGVPQGGPLSPLLSNIVLDELDHELSRRGHRFVRYADDANIFVRSERAGQRIMESIERFIRRRLRLKMNAEKSAVARPSDRHFLGFRLRVEPETGEVEIMHSERTRRRAFERIRALTPRNWGSSLTRCISALNVYLRGWFGFFKICSARAAYLFRNLDARIRRRLRAIQLKHWKRRRTIARNLISLGVQRKTAWRRVYEGRQSIWVLSHNSAVERGLRNAYFAERGLVSLAELYRQYLLLLAAPRQLKLDLG
jgi:group II intron reverse transcriptase/maturase